MRKDLPAKNFKEFVAYAKANKEQDAVRLGRRRRRGASRLRAAQLRVGITITHVPYRGTGPAMQDLHGGRIDFLCEIITTAKPQVDGGTVKALAIFDKARSHALPELADRGASKARPISTYTWNALFLPKDTPEPIVKKLNAAAVEAMKSPAVKRAADRTRRADRFRRSHDAGLSRHLPEGRDREMGRADQGRGRAGGVRLQRTTNPLFVMARHCRAC